MINLRLRERHYIFLAFQFFMGIKLKSKINTKILRICFAFWNSYNATMYVYTWCNYEYRILNKAVWPDFKLSPIALFHLQVMAWQRKTKSTNSILFCSRTTTRHTHFKLDKYKRISTFRYFLPVCRPQWNECLHF